jgi:hypothetical protein
VGFIGLKTVTIVSGLLSIITEMIVTFLLLTTISIGFCQNISDYSNPMQSEKSQQAEQEPKNRASATTPLQHQKHQLPPKLQSKEPSFFILSELGDSSPTE